MEKSNSQNINNLVVGLTYLYPKNMFIKNLQRAILQFPDLMEEDFFSPGQIQSKQWLVDELHKLEIYLGTVYLTPGWYGLLGHLINEKKLNFESIKSFDTDKKSVEVSELINYQLLVDNWKFKATCLDIFNINYREHHYATIKKNKNLEPQIEIPQTIINTACEHIDYKKWLELIPAGKLLVLQNNDFFDCKEHTHCVTSLEEFQNNCALSECLYSGVLKLNKYNRYMLIGRK